MSSFSFNPTGGSHVTLALESFTSGTKICSGGGGSKNE